MWTKDWWTHSWLWCFVWCVSITFSTSWDKEAWAPSPEISTLAAVVDLTAASLGVLCPCCCPLRWVCAGDYKGEVWGECWEKSRETMVDGWSGLCVRSQVFLPRLSCLDFPACICLHTSPKSPTVYLEALSLCPDCTFKPCMAFWNCGTILYLHSPQKESSVTFGRWEKVETQVSI